MSPAIEGPSRPAHRPFQGALIEIAEDVDKSMVEVGSWFVLERWITDAPFRHAEDPGQSDLDVARGTQAKQILEHHWDTWITEEDFTWIADRGINTVRIPIGYYHVCGADPSVLQGTDFADHFNVYEDLHAAPGKQNRDAHSGTSSPDTKFFTKQNMAHTTHVLTVLLTRLSASSLPNIVGIELINEPAPENHISELQKWYIDTSRALRKIDPRIPIYIGDAWQTDQWAGFIEANSQNLPFLVLDHHLYRCFTQQDASTPVAQHIHNLRDPNASTPQTFARISQKLQSAGSALIVGEWSGALNPGSLHGVSNEIEMRRDYIAAQLALYEQYCAGYYFWTYKKEHLGDKGWSFRDAVDAGVFPAQVGIWADRIRDKMRMGLKNKDNVNNGSNDSDDNTRKKDEARAKALDEHARYWAQYPGHYEHWRFSAGFVRGWDDAWLFFTSISSLPASRTVPELGFKGACVKRRTAEHVKEKGGSGSLWEFEHGYSQGINVAYDEMVTGN
ncbi:glycoside hydrolase [Cristinia sonorae]|uniref:Glycoside hydrolase n=1 Tax=Cristinia sonorae TaxID=1940300 RepID=A0A8K0UER1_9AGAR|nr:glycoside hydrolase [Cristinia sonorae]